jgi:hypothetical protein
VDGGDETGAAVSVEGVATSPPDRAARATTEVARSATQMSTSSALRGKSRRRFIRLRLPSSSFVDGVLETLKSPLDHLVGGGERDAEVAGGVYKGARQDEDIPVGESLGEQEVVFDG